MKERPKSLDRALEEAVSRALRDNLAPLQRTADDLHQAYADLVAACSSTRPTNALPAMLRAQTAASALAAGLSVLSNFVAVALKPRDSSGTVEAEDLAEAASSVAHSQARSAPAAVAEPEEEDRVRAGTGTARAGHASSAGRSSSCRTICPVGSGRGPGRRRRVAGLQRGQLAARNSRSASPRESSSQSGHARHQTIAAERRESGSRAQGHLYPVAQ